MRRGGGGTRAGEGGDLLCRVLTEGRLGARGKENRKKVTKKKDGRERKKKRKEEPEEGEEEPEAAGEGGSRVRRGQNEGKRRQVSARAGSRGALSGNSGGSVSGGCSEMHEAEEAAKAGGASETPVLTCPVCTVHLKGSLEEGYEHINACLDAQHAQHEFDRQSAAGLVVPGHDDEFVVPRGGHSARASVSTSGASTTTSSKVSAATAPTTTTTTTVEVDGISSSFPLPRAPKHSQNESMEEELQRIDQRIAYLVERRRCLLSDIQRTMRRRSRNARTSRAEEEAANAVAAMNVADAAQDTERNNIELTEAELLAPTPSLPLRSVSETACATRRRHAASSSSSSTGESPYQRIPSDEHAEVAHMHLAVWRELMALAAQEQARQHGLQCHAGSRAACAAGERGSRPTSGSSRRSAQPSLDQVCEEQQYQQPFDEDSDIMDLPFSLSQSQDPTGVDDLEGETEEDQARRAKQAWLESMSGLTQLVANTLLSRSRVRAATTRQAHCVVIPPPAAVREEIRMALQHADVFTRCPVDAAGGQAAAIRAAPAHTSLWQRATAANNSTSYNGGTTLVPAVAAATAAVCAGQAGPAGRASGLSSAAPTAATAGAAGGACGLFTTKPLPISRWLTTVMQLPQGDGAWSLACDHAAATDSADEDDNGAEDLWRIRLEELRPLAAQTCLPNVPRHSSPDAAVDVEAAEAPDPRPVPPSPPSPPSPSPFPSPASTAESSNSSVPQRATEPSTGAIAAAPIPETRVAKRRRPPSPAPSVVSDTSTAATEPIDGGNRILEPQIAALAAEALAANRKLWEAMLCFEPVDIVEIQAVIGSRLDAHNATVADKRGGCCPRKLRKPSRIAVQHWLDAQGVLTRLQQTTGARTRRKRRLRKPPG